ncbi:MAG: hypothetical protein LH467_07410 [Gemmatimonadaceae bacterium]|nr:hypothetical protein [Gemmatimonadaceae bacterium]
MERLQEREERTKRAVHVNKPRHCVTEARAIVASHWEPIRLRYRELLRLTGGGSQRPLALAIRQDIVRAHTGQPVALRLRVLRESRNRTGETVRVRLPLDDGAREVLAQVDTPGSAPNARLFNVPLHVLALDPRIELAFALWAAMRVVTSASRAARSSILRRHPWRRTGRA